MVAIRFYSRWPFFAGGVLLGLGLGLAVLKGFGRQPTASSAVQTLAPANSAGGLLAPGVLGPGFELKAVAGETIKLEDLRGQVVLLNFWATWCAPCEVEMPSIQQAFEAYHDQGFTVLAVDFDEPAQDVQAFAAQLGLTFPLLLDPGGEVQSLYQVRGYPTSVFLDPRGVIRVYHIGIMSDRQLKGYLAQMGFGSW